MPVAGPELVAVAQSTGTDLNTPGVRLRALGMQVGVLGCRAATTFHSQEYNPRHTREFIGEAIGLAQAIAKGVLELAQVMRALLEP